MLPKIFYVNKPVILQSSMRDAQEMALTVPPMYEEQIKRIQ